MCWLKVKQFLFLNVLVRLLKDANITNPVFDVIH